MHKTGSLVKGVKKAAACFGGILRPVSYTHLYDFIPSAEAAPQTTSDLTADFVECSLPEYPTPVSYTHLDVYKKHLKFLLRPKRNAVAPVKIAASALRIPVSYTHLDVYKRQA